MSSVFFFLIVPHLYFSKVRLFVCYECFACQERWIALDVATYRLLWAEYGCQVLTKAFCKSSKYSQPLSHLSLPHFTVLGQGLSLNLKLIILARVADQWALRIHLPPFFPLPQDRLYLIFHMGARDLNLGLYAYEVSILSTEPSPRTDVRLDGSLFAWFCTKLNSRKKLA